MAISGLGSIRLFDHASRSAERATEQIARGAAGETARPAAAGAASVEGATDIATLTEGMVGRFGEVADRWAVVQVEPADGLPAGQVGGRKRGPRRGGGIPREASPEPAARRGDSGQA